MDKISSKYAGKCIALIDDHIVADAKTELDAYQKAKRLYPQKMISLMYVPHKKEMFTFL